jgi:hypothetical protein
LSNTVDHLFWGFAASLAQEKKVLIVQPTLEELSRINDVDPRPSELVYISEQNYELTGEGLKHRSDSAERKASKDLIIDPQGMLSIDDLTRILKKNAIYLTLEARTLPEEFQVLSLEASIGQFLFVDINESGIFEHLDSQLTDDAPKASFGYVASTQKDLSAKLNNFALIQDLEAQTSAIDSDEKEQLETNIIALKEEVKDLKDKLKASNAKKKADPALIALTDEKNQVIAQYEVLKAELDTLKVSSSGSTELQEQLAQAQANVSLLEVQYANVQKLQKTYQSQADQLRNEGKKLSSENAAFKDALDAKDAQIEAEKAGVLQVAEDLKLAFAQKSADYENQIQAQRDQAKVDQIKADQHAQVLQAKIAELQFALAQEQKHAEKERLILQAELDRASIQDQNQTQKNQAIAALEESYQLVSVALKQWLQNNIDLPLPQAPIAQPQLVKTWCEQLIQYQPVLKANLEVLKEIEQLKASLAQQKLEYQALKQQKEQDSKAFTAWRKISSTKAHDQALQSKLDAEIELRKALEAQVQANEEAFVLYENELQRLEIALTQALEPKELKLSKDNPVLLKVEIQNQNAQLSALENILKLNQNTQAQLNSSLMEKVTEISKLSRNKQKLEEEVKLLKIDFDRLSKGQPIIGVYQHIYASLMAENPNRAKSLLSTQALSPSAVQTETAQADASAEDLENVKFLLKQKIKSVRDAELKGTSIESTVEEDQSRIDRQKERLQKMIQSTKGDSKSDTAEDSTFVASNDQAIETIETTVTSAVSTEYVQEKSPIDKLRERLKKMNKA